MSLLFMDGFDHTGNGSPDLVAHGKWGANVGFSIALTSTTTQSRTGGHSAQMYYQGDETETKPYLAIGGFVVGMAIRFNQAPGGGDFIRIKEGATIHLALAMTAGAVLQVKVGSTVIATGITVLPMNSWVYVEFKGVIHDTAGSYEVHIDGVAEASLTNAGPVDTRNAGATGQWDRVSVLPTSTGWTSFVDDFYLCDLSGTSRNDFLGPIKIDTLMPQPGNGTNVGFTPSTGTDHGALVDENPPNTTDYNGGATVGLKDTYNLTNPTLSGAILGIQVNMYAAKSDVGGRKVVSVVRVGGTDYDGSPDLPLITTFQYVSQVRSQNPGTSADWTVADVTALEAGMKVTV
jgi:hypothetical protein